MRVVVGASHGLPTMVSNFFYLSSHGGVPGLLMGVGLNSGVGLKKT